MKLHFILLFVTVLSPINLCVADKELQLELAHSFTEKDKSWWALQPLKNIPPPKNQTSWTRNPIDQFIKEKLDKAKLTPATEASRTELVRRAYFDLHGLPPSTEQVDAFLKDLKPGAWERLIDNLLASPRYGERWAQHWLEVVRYADSDGYREDAYRSGAKYFKSYIIKSFNNDKPYKQLIKEHLAGDELDPDNPDVVIGTSFLRQGVYEWNLRDVRMQWDLILNEMTRVTSEVFLGLSMGCAQCHNHKFDPILQKDYLGLQAFFSSVSWPTDAYLSTLEQKNVYHKKKQEWEKKTKSIRNEMHNLAKKNFEKDQDVLFASFPDDVQKLYKKTSSNKSTYEKQLSYLIDRQLKRAANRFNYTKALKKDQEKLQRYLELQKQLKTFDNIKPKPLTKAFIASDISQQAAPTYLKQRTGTTEISPTFLALLKDKPVIKATKTTTGRRTALANWIASDSNPLSARVMVNRLWQHHFGKGIVATPNEFGSLGEAPSHPELLDWLTNKFLKNDWKLKALHKLIMNSATYRQTAQRVPTDDILKVDPENKLLWHFSPLRLDSEQIRDAMLSISGELKHVSGPQAVSGTTPYRSIFVKKMRNKPDEMLASFDAPPGLESAPERDATTSPIQTLLMVNGDWSVNRSRAFAKRLLKEKKVTDESVIKKAFQMVYHRPPENDEADSALKFIQLQEKSYAPKPDSPSKPKVETGLRNTNEHFKGLKNLGLNDHAIWLQPGSDFERLQWKPPQLWSNTFTIETITHLDRMHSDASVNTLASRWDNNKKKSGWSLGVTSQRSRYQPRNIILQLSGRNFQDQPKYEVIVSDLRFPVGKPVYLAVSISSETSKQNPTSGFVTFYLKDLSDPNSKMQTAKFPTSVVSKVQNSQFPIVLGGLSNMRSHLWDGQIAKFKIHTNLLTEKQLLLNNRSQANENSFNLNIRGDQIEEPIANSSWLRHQHKVSHSIPERRLRATTDFCQALFNSNEFLYLH